MMARKAAETAIVAVEEPQGGAIANPWAEVQWEDDGAGDIAPSFPLVKLVQGVSKMEGSSKHVGDFWRSDTEEFLGGEITIVPLYQKRTRAMFRKGEETPACLSLDGLVPLPNQDLWGDRPAPAACEVCPFSKWGEDGERPACSESLVVLAVLEDTGEGEPELVQLRIGGANLRPWRSFVARRIAPKRLPLCAFELTLSSKEMTKGGNKWMGLVVDGRPLSVAAAAGYNALLRTHRERFEAEAAQAARDAAEDAVGTRQAGDGWDTPETLGAQQAAMQWDSGD